MTGREGDRVGFIELVIGGVVGERVGFFEGDLVEGAREGRRLVVGLLEGVAMVVYMEASDV